MKVDEEESKGTKIAYSTCPNCEEIVVYLQRGELEYDNIGMDYFEDIEWQKMIYPKKENFTNSDDIPKLYLEDYEESVKVLSASPKASAALSRRLLQNILREEYKIKEKTLVQEIQNFIELEGIPSHLTDAVDAVRNIGNLAAHPTKNKNTGEIVSVENGEAEWLIEVIEALFDFTFIQPLKLQRRRKELNLKLEQIGKPEMKKKE
ncbi:DUF4145 domain-containing protein [Polaribacter pacificus]|nr:DUF4145 domain-containing protein [Polaribacter pacificus]